MQAQELTPWRWTTRCLGTALVFLTGLVFSAASAAETDDYQTPGTYTWVAPPGVSSVTVEAWGGGGAGGGATGNRAAGGGGAGGQYARRVVTVVPGNSYAVVVGAGGTGSTGNGQPGGESRFGTNAVVAKGGAGGEGESSNNRQGAGGLGSTTGGVGDHVYRGGNGANGKGQNNPYGGGGGGGAGSGGAGGDADRRFGGSGTNVGGGNGARGSTSESNGSGGSGAGGGGAGANATDHTDHRGGNGGAGRVQLTYTIPELVLTANGQSGTVAVVTGEPVAFEATAYNCSGSGTQQWRDSWAIDGVQQSSNTYTSTTCSRSPIAWPHPFPGGTYDVSARTEYRTCTLQIIVCLTWSSWTTHGEASVTIEVTGALDVTAISRADPNPTTADSVSWTVRFNRPVTGVDLSDFMLASSGITGATLSGISGNGDTYTVTASTGSGSGTLGLNLVDNDSIHSTTGGYVLGGSGPGNGNFTGEVYNITSQEMCSSENVFTDDFNRSNGDPGDLWATASSSGSFGPPKIVNHRLRLTDATGNNAAAATLMKLFPGAGNKVVVEFDHFAHGGNGADGIAITFSDAEQTPIPGAFGGSLGYAQKNTTDCPSCPGFNGGWLGVGIDEFGNYSNPSEGRVGGPGARQDSVAIRGSGSGQSGYRYHTGTAANLNPQVDNNGSASPPHRYRITLDHLDGSHAWVSVERDTGSGYQMLINPYDAKAQSGQAEVPANWLVSYTGSTGGSTNIHEIDNLRVCATDMVAYQTEIDHFEFYYDSPATACAPQSIRVRACQNASCSERVVGSITATFTDGKTRTFSSDDTLQFEYTSNSTVGSTSSEPPLKPLSQPKCFDTDGNPRANCSIAIQGSGFSITVPNHVAATPQAATIKAQSAGCGSLLANQTRYVSFWSGYANPSDNPANSSVTINGTPIAKASPGSGMNLSFNASGEATFTLVYPDAGAMRLNASCSASSCGTQLTGNTVFVAKPKAFMFSAIKAGAINNAGGTDKWIAAGQPFDFTLTAVNANDVATPNFGRELSPDTIIIGSNLVAPAGGANPAVVPPGEPPTHLSSSAFSAGVAAANGFSWGEVGNIKLTAVLGDDDYLGAGEVKGESGLVGRFIPFAFDIEPTNDGTLANAMTAGATAFTYTGQPFDYGDNPAATITAVNTEGATVTNYTGLFNKLTLTDVEVTYPTQDNAQPQAGASCAAPGDPGCLAVSITTEPGNANHSLDGDHGVFTFTLGAVASDTFSYPRDATSLVGPFTAALTLTISDVTDGDGVSDTGPVDLNPTGTLIRYGRGYVRDVYGTYGNPGDTLMLPVGSEYFLGAGRWALNSDDFGGRFSCSKSESGITVNPLPLGNVTLLGGIGDLGLTVSADAAPPGGNVEVDFTWPDAWLPGPSKARATFGVFRSDDRFLYWQEP